MNTNQLKRFAKDARIKLLDQVGRKLEFVLGNTSQSFIATYSSQLASLRNKIQQTGKEQLIEMVAYTWFNRLMAFRFMDANGYTIPKVATPLPGMTNPEILQNALGGNIEQELHLDRQRLNDLLDGKTAAADTHTEAFKMLLVASCNQWHNAMPFMFERISDYTELLLPDDLLSDYSIVTDIRNGMCDEDCQQEELIGWLYQFYISDKKDDVFEGLKKNIKITAENIPAATQLFTPHWIVRYMVENTLGKLWLTFKHNSRLRQHMPYYIEAPESNLPAPLPDGIKGVTDITFLDPCQGSGHVLVYAFDLFSKIYEEEGYNTNEIPALILQHNLFGIDIDERAAQLAAFALIMKARNYYPRFLRKTVHPNVIALENVSEDILKQAVKIPLAVAGKLIYDYRDLSLYLLIQADNYGSLIQIDPEELKALQIQKGSLWQEQEVKMVLQAEYLSRQYHCVVTNPPYMGGKGMNDSMKFLLSEKFEIGKSDLFGAFILRCQDFILKNGFAGMVTMESWMFLSSFETLRKHIIENATINSLSHFGWHIMRIAFGTCSFILQKSEPNEQNKGTYSFLEIENMDKEKEIPYSFPLKENGRFNIINQKYFEKIPGSPIGYWVSEKFYSVWDAKESLVDITISDGQNKTGDNEKYLRYHWEIGRKCYQDGNWIQYAKGGPWKKWYGNINLLIDWSENARIHYRKDKIARLIPEYLWYKTGVSWSFITTKDVGFRLLPSGGTFDVQGSTLFFHDEKRISEILALLNSKPVKFFLKILNPTISLQVKDVRSIPIPNNYSQNEASELANQLIEISKIDWVSDECSIDFASLPILSKESLGLLKESYTILRQKWQDATCEMKSLEENNNTLFINAFGLQDEVSSAVSWEEITLNCNPWYRFGKKAPNITSFPVSDDVELDLLIDTIGEVFSYSIGCVFGRYSLEKPMLILANQGETIQDFLMQVPNPSFMPDEDNIIPVLDGEWFTDDIVGRFKVFLRAAFGQEHYEENLRYIEETIGKDIRKYFVKDFYNDHIKRYKKRPIYWMFSSPKGHFKALIYMHRYQPDLCSKLLNDYLQAFISKLESAKQSQTRFIQREDISAREKTAALRETDKLELMLRDCREYEKTLFTIATQKISIDLDDGVKVNYQMFKEVLVPIKGLEKEEE